MQKDFYYVLFSRKEKMFKGKKFFFERWVERKSKSGIVCYSDVKDSGCRYYVVEGYGVGTINTDTFSEIDDGCIAPIQRSKHRTEPAARRALIRLMNENIKDMRKYRDEIEDETNLT